MFPHRERYSSGLEKSMRKRMVIGPILATALLGGVVAYSALQISEVHPVDEKILREYAGVYQWNAVRTETPEHAIEDAFVYLQMWSEFTGTNQLVAFDESGEVRVLYPTDRDRFFAGYAGAVPAVIESRIEFVRDTSGKITSLIWQGASARRTARRVDIEKRDA